MSGVFVKSIECGDRILGTTRSWALIDIKNEVSHGVNDSYDFTDRVVTWRPCWASRYWYLSPDWLCQW